MLKKGLLYIVTILFATYFLLAGSGFNVVNYCCNSCAEAGIAALVKGSCEVVHHHSPTLKNNRQSDDVVCSNVEHQPNGCHLLRLFIDTPSTVGRLVITDNTINSIDLFCAIENNLILRSLFSSFTISSPPDYCFFSSGREMITYYSVLLI